MHNGRPDVVEWHIQDMKIGHRADKVKRKNLKILREQGTTLKYSHNFGKITQILEKLISSGMLFFEVITLSVSIPLNG